jgi:hypothetical protein
MDEILTQDLKKQFDALPPEVQKAISGVDLPTKLQEIVKNNKLMIDQAGGLEVETILVLFGLEPLENYTKNLINNVGLTSIQASVVAHDVNESIFKGVRDILKQINDAMVSEEKNPAKQDIVPTKENVLAGIEQPENIKNTESSISISSLKSNTSAIPETHPEMASEGIEIKINNLPEIAPEAILPATRTSMSIPVPPGITKSSTEPIHVNISPVQNIVETKMTETVAVPKITIAVEEKTKLPEKSTASSDPYREAAM